MKTEKRLLYLASMISKYKSNWGKHESHRLYGWVDEYENIRLNQPTAFKQYCANNLLEYHSAYDLLA